MRTVRILWSYFSTNQFTMNLEQLKKEALKVFTPPTKVERELLKRYLEMAFALGEREEIAKKLEELTEEKNYCGACGNGLPVGTNNCGGACSDHQD